MLKTKAYSKVNLGLNILGTRPDGYHELEMVMIPLELADKITMIRSEEYNLISNIELPENNTIFKAIETARKYYGFKDNYTVVLEKEIPSQAGLGGGSSDGAAVLRLLKDIYKWKDLDTYIQAAKEVGADVPFFLFNTPAVVKGIGEQIMPFSIKKDYYVLLIKPSSGVSTVQAYKNYDETKADFAQIPQMVQALKEGEEFSEFMGNSLEEVAFRLNPAIQPIKNEIKSLGFESVLMSGSGSTVFVIDENKDKLEVLKERFQARYTFVCLTKLVK